MLHKETCSRMMEDSLDISLFCNLQMDSRRPSWCVDIVNGPGWISKRSKVYERYTVPRRCGNKQDVKTTLGSTRTGFMCGSSSKSEGSLDRGLSSREAFQTTILMRVFYAWSWIDFKRIKSLWRTKSVPLQRKKPYLNTFPQCDAV